MQKEQLETNSRTLLRLNSSPYLKNDFIFKEKSIATKLGLNYLDSFSQTAEIIISNTHCIFSKSDLRLHENTKLIIHPNSGYDNFSFDFVSEFKGNIIIGSEIRKLAVSEFILSSLWRAICSIPSEKSWSRDRRFNRSLLSKKNVLILGFGKIGKTIYESLKLHNCHIVISDPYKGYIPNLDQYTFDIVIVCCSQNVENINIIDMRFLEKLSSDFVLINTARGELVDLNALIEILKSRPEAQAFIDVFSPEPFDFSQFNEISNLNCSSHIAGFYPEIDDATLDFEFMVLDNYLKLSDNDFNEKYKELNLKDRIYKNFII